MSQPITDWYIIPGRSDVRAPCAAIGCIVYAAITNGEKCLCDQHATEIAMNNAVILRAMHDIHSHRDDGICLFCGEHDWYLQYGCWHCSTCYPQNVTNGTPTRDILPVSSFGKLPDASVLKKFKPLSPIPSSEEERARSLALNLGRTIF